jgi:chaperonin GroEL (HSP60 family)
LKQVLNCAVSCAIDSNFIAFAADKDHFAELAVTAIMRLKGTGNLESIHIIKKPGGALKV